MMNAIRNRLAGVRRPIRVAALAIAALFLAGEARLVRPVWRLHDGGIWGDSFTYVSFARQLARGHFFFDHPTAPLIAEHHEGKLAVNGPVWNTSIRPDGRVVYSVAIGYPAFLAAACKAGGVWLMLHANLLLMTLLLVLLVVIAWDSMGRSFEGLVVACATALLLPRMDAATFNQFTYPWREPLSYIFVLGSAWAVLRFRQTRGYILLPLAGFLLGCACAVKEANFIYGIWLGLFGILTPGVARQRAFWLAACAAAGAALLGLAPLLVQNYICTGNPLVSLQSLRETAQFSMTQGGAGLSAGNIPDMLGRYAGMYGALPVFRWSVLLAVAGIVLACRTVTGRFWAGLLAIHLALYIQWNADFRHMFFALIPYTFFVAFGAWRIIRAAGTYAAARHAEVAVAFAAVAAILALAAAPRPWAGVLPAPQDRLAFRDLQFTVSGIESQMPSNALVLANRPLRDHWAVYGRLPVARLHELTEVGSFTNVYDTLTALTNRGHALIFIDGTDRDPRNIGQVDLAVVDREWLLWRHDLELVQRLDACDMPILKRLTDNASLNVFSVQPWSNSRTDVECSVPTGGVAFIRVHPRQAGDDLEVTVGDQSVGRVAGGYVPWTGPLTGRTVRVSFTRRSGLPVPAEPSVRLVGWDEPIRQETHPFADPPDTAWFPDGLTDQPVDVRFRSLFGPTRIRVPLRIRPDLFAAVCLQVVRVEEGQDGFRVRTPDNPEQSDPLSYYDPWVPIRTTRSPFVGHGEFALLNTPASGLRLYGVHVYAAHTRYEARTVGDCAVLAVAGFLCPDTPGLTNRPWSVTVNGAPHASGFAPPNALRNPHRVFIVPVQGQSLYTLAWSGAGVIAPFSSQTGSRLTIAMDSPSRAFCESGFYNPEPGDKGTFAWTMGEALVRVPLTAGASGYSLRMRATDGNPAADRKVTVQVGTDSIEVALTDDLREYALTIPPQNVAEPMATVRLKIEIWSPQKVLGVQDGRDLGFQFHGLVWEPISLRREDTL